MLVQYLCIWWLQSSLCKCVFAWCLLMCVSDALSAGQRTLWLIPVSWLYWGLAGPPRRAPLQRQTCTRTRTRCCCERSDVKACTWWGKQGLHMDTGQIGDIHCSTYNWPHIPEGLSVFSISTSQWHYFFPPYFDLHSPSWLIRSNTVSKKMSIRVATAAAAAVTTAAFVAAAGAHMEKRPEKLSPATARWTAVGSAQLLTPSASSPTTSPSAVLSLQKRLRGVRGRGKKNRVQV